MGLLNIYESLDELPQIFAENARFKDPFNDVNGIMAIRQIFVHMFETTQNSRFIVKHYAQQASSSQSPDATHAQTLFLHWDYTFNSHSGKAWLISGTSLVQFNSQNKVIEHIDFWDPAESLYEKIPLLGSLMRFLKKRLQIQTNNKK